MTCARFFISRVARQAEHQQQPEESRVKRSSASTPPRGIATELRAMKPLPKRRTYRRVQSHSPPPIFEVKRPRLSEGNRVTS